MLFKSTIVALIASASALRPNNGIPVESKQGMKLMSQARELDQNGDQDDDDMSWIAGYSIKYLGCSALLQVREDGGEDEANLYIMNLAKFALCPSGTACSSCGNGSAQYAVSMDVFVDAYTEMAMSAQETACENIRENCNCEDDANDDEACENQCYTNMGMEACIEYEGDEEFEIQEYLECQEIEGGNDDNNNNNNNYNNNNNDGGYNPYQTYYVGPTCSDGFDINLAVFTDEGCSTKAGSGIYEAMTYGNSLPYENEPIVAGDCIECKQVDEDDNDNNNNNGDDNQQEEYEILELCEETYEDAAKCESALSGKYYNDESGCEYINSILPTLEKATQSITKSSFSNSGSAGAATGWAIFFFLTAVVMSAYSFFLYRKIHRAKVNLSSSEGQLA